MFLPYSPLATVDNQSNLFCSDPNSNASLFSSVKKKATPKEWSFLKICQDTAKRMSSYCPGSVAAEGKCQIKKNGDRRR